jgi:hypothetical protein
VSDFLETKRKEIDARIRELEPLIAEYRELEAAASALAGLPDTSSRNPRFGARTTRRTTTRATAARTTRPRGAGGRRGRPRSSGTRALQTLELVKAKPGITIPEIASAMGIKQNYLYRVLPRLERDRLVTKQDRGWHAVEGADPPGAIFPPDEVWCPLHKQYHAPPAH